MDNIIDIVLKEYDKEEDYIRLISADKFKKKWVKHHLLESLHGKDATFYGQELNYLDYSFHPSLVPTPDTNKANYSTDAKKDGYDVTHIYDGRIIGTYKYKPLAIMICNALIEHNILGFDRQKFIDNRTTIEKIIKNVEKLFRKFGK